MRTTRWRWTLLEGLLLGLGLGVILGAIIATPRDFSGPATYLGIALFVPGWVMGWFRERAERAQRSHTKRERERQLVEEPAGHPIVDLGTSRRDD